MDIFKRAADYVKTMWGNLNNGQRTILVILGAALVLSVVWGANVASTEPMAKLVGAEVREEDRSQILEKLKEKNQIFEIRDKEIFVPRKDADRVMLELVGEGVAVSDKAIWQFLETTDIAAGKWQLEKRYQLAVQRKLERMIRNVNGVRNASVQLTPASEAATLGFAGGKARAAVQVELKNPDQKLDRGSVKAIIGLVAKAVQGLDQGEVHLMDTQGRPYLVPGSDGNIATLASLAERESEIEQKIKSNIIDLFPNAMVSVRAVAKKEEKRTKERKYGNPKAVREEERKRTEDSLSGNAVVGMKAVGSVEQPAEGGGMKKKEVDTGSEAHYAMDTTDTDVSYMGGSIEKITVAVKLPIMVGENTQQEVEKAKLDEPKIKELVLAAAGPEADANSVKVMLVPTRPVEPLPAPKFSEEAKDWLGTNWPTILLFTLALAGLFMMFRVVKAAMPKGVTEEMEALRQRIAEEVATPAMPEVALADREAGRIKLGIREMITRNPRGVAGIVKRWLAGK